MKCRKHKKANILKKLTALVCAGSVLLSLCSCSADVIKYGSVPALNTISDISDKPMIHYSEKSELTAGKITDTGLLGLFADKKNCSFAVYDKTAKSLWSALPLNNENRGEQNEASVVALEILGGTDIYALNSQDNSVAYSKASLKKTDNGLSLIYNIYPNSETAKKKQLSADDIAFRVSLDLKAEDSTVFLSCKTKNLSGNKNASIVSLKLLNFFGAYNTASKGDFIFVPDGCGAIIKTDVQEDTFESITLPVYGSCTKPDLPSACVPAFGIKHGNSALAAIITSGDTCAEIKADKATDSSEYNRVYSEYHLNDYLYENNNLYAGKASDESEIKVTLRFLSDKNASYSGIACACREQLIRNGVLTTRSLDSSNGLAFNLSVIGAVNDGKKDRVFTDYEQAADMLTRMRNKGIGNINLRYMGLTNALNSEKNKSSYSFGKKFGTKDELDSLYSYCSIHNIGLFVDIIPFIASGGMFAPKAKCIDGSALTLTNNSSYFSGNSNDIKLRALNSFSDFTSAVLKDTSGYSFSGFCFGNAGKILYSDYSSGFISKEKSKKIINDTLGALSGEKPCEIEGCNFCIVKNADIITAVPEKTGYSATGAYIPVPFVQIILHGICDYSGTPINTQANREEAMLRCVEYGACPCFEWSYTALNKDDSTYCVDSTINTAAEFYTKANAVLGDLRGARITDHSTLGDGVTRTVYDNGSIIYVNFTDTDFTVSGAVVSARDFIRVN